MTGAIPFLIVVRRCSALPLVLALFRKATSADAVLNPVSFRTSAKVHRLQFSVRVGEWLDHSFFPMSEHPTQRPRLLALFRRPVILSESERFTNMRSSLLESLISCQFYSSANLCTQTSFSGEIYVANLPCFWGMHIQSTVADLSPQAPVLVRREIDYANHFNSPEYCQGTGLAKPYGGDPRHVPASVGRYGRLLPVLHVRGATDRCAGMRLAANRSPCTA